MCGGGRPPAPDTRAQDESLRLQREQMELQRQQMERQAAQYQEQLRISTAPPPPAPAPVADSAAPALEDSMAATPSQTKTGTGRRKLRTDLPAGGSGGLSIPAA